MVTSQWNDEKFEISEWQVKSVEKWSLVSGTIRTLKTSEWQVKSVEKWSPLVSGTIRSWRQANGR